MIIYDDLDDHLDHLDHLDNDLDDHFHVCFGSNVYYF